MTGTRQMVVTLVIVALVCSVVLSFVYSYTAPRIAETQTKLTLSGLQEVMDAHEFVAVIPDTVWHALDESGSMLGIVFRVFPQGYAGAIPITVGLDPQGTITGIKIASAAEGMKETPGLGAKITEKSFTDQFVGKSAESVMIKKDGGEIDAITAATISSRAVCNGVKNGIETYTCYIGRAVNKTCVFKNADTFIEIIKDTLWYALAELDTLGVVCLGIIDGYADRIEFLLGVDAENNITGVEVVYSNETPGIGELICDRKFLEVFRDSMPDAISGATVSSRALIDAVQAVHKRCTEYLR
jgi:electron transport complex protein RnfG